MLHTCPEPIEDVAERYVMDRLPRGERIQFEEHLKGCPDCQFMVEDAEDFLSAFRNAAVRIAPDENRCA